MWEDLERGLVVVDFVVALIVEKYCLIEIGMMWIGLGYDGVVERTGFVLWLSLFAWVFVWVEAYPPKTKLTCWLGMCFFVCRLRGYEVVWLGTGTGVCLRDCGGWGWGWWWVGAPGLGRDCWIGCVGDGTMVMYDCVCADYANEQFLPVVLLSLACVCVCVRVCVRACVCVCV